MSSNKSGRVLVAAAVAAALCLSLAGPAAAADGSRVSPGALERLAAWITGLWMPEAVALDGAATGNPPVEEDEDPESCRGEYSACLDPNGIILPPPAPIRRVP